MHMVVQCSFLDDTDWLVQLSSCYPLTPLLMKPFVHNFIHINILFCMKSFTPSHTLGYITVCVEGSAEPAWRASLTLLPPPPPQPGTVSSTHTHQLTHHSWHWGHPLSKLWRRERKETSQYYLGQGALFAGLLWNNIATIYIYIYISIQHVTEETWAL